MSPIIVGLYLPYTCTHVYESLSAASVRVALYCTADIFLLLFLLHHYSWVLYSLYACLPVCVSLFMLLVLNRVQPFEALESRSEKDQRH